MRHIIFLSLRSSSSEKMVMMTLWAFPASILMLAGLARPGQSSLLYTTKT